MNIDFIIIVGRLQLRLPHTHTSQQVYEFCSVQAQADFR